MLCADTCLSISTVMRQKQGIILSDEIYAVSLSATHVSPAHSYPEGHNHFWRAEKCVAQVAGGSAIWLSLNL